MRVYCIFFILLSWQCRTTHSHGRLIQPPSRSSAWRYGFNSPVNTNDVGLNCGGLWRQTANNGRCGLCGDAFDGPQHHMAGGMYALPERPIVGCYERSKTMDVKVEITASHLGYFEFRLCENNNKNKPITEECLNKHLLTIDGTAGQTRYPEVPGKGIHNIVLNLPNVVCEQCVLQWKWHTGNNWGCDSNDPSDCGKGKGPQEEFVGCADIKILDVCRSSSTHSQQTLAPPTPAPPTRAPPTLTPMMTQAPPTWAPSSPAPPTAAPVTPVPSSGNTHKCKATGFYKGRPDITDWCNMHCPMGHCPPSHCECEPVTVSPPTDAPTRMPNPNTVVPPTGTDPSTCIARGNNPGQWATQWCIVHCSIGYCPPSLCKCGSMASASSPLH